MLGRTNRFQTKTCKQLLQSAVPTLNDLSKSFKDLCDPELDLAMFYHVLTDSLFLSDEEIKRVYKKYSSTVK